MDYDFSGYATRYNKKCSDGRTIADGAFAHLHGKKVPIFWSHQHKDVEKVLGHAILEVRPGDGVYAYCSMNNSLSGKAAREAVVHKDVESLSIFADRLNEINDLVHNGEIRELSLVMAGANPGAFIDNVVIQHGDGEMEELDQAIIYSGDYIELNESEDMPKLKHEDETDGETIGDIINSMNDKQKNVVGWMLKQAASGALSHSDTDEDDEADEDEDDDADADDSETDSSEMDNDAENGDGDDEATDTASGEVQHSKEGSEVSHNIFEQQGPVSATGPTKVRKHLTHEQIMTIAADAKRCGSFKEAVLAHAEDYGIDNMEVLFPDAKAIQQAPEFIKRQTEWVASVLSKTNHRPFAKIKTMLADITHEEARAKGYIKGNLKKEEFFRLAKRETTPTTVYKKQKLDRDDIIDITDMDVVAWLWGEMRLMLNEEIARAVLFGDGRDFDDEDKIDESKIRPVAKDADLYATQVALNIDTGNLGIVDWHDVVDSILLARENYKGSGNPDFYTTETYLTRMLLVRDNDNKRMYRNVAELASDLRVSSIIAVDPDVVPDGIFGVMVNLTDYSIGTNAGGEISKFDDFDIDYNQYKYLLEGRMSGALTKYKSAVVFRTALTNAGALNAPVFDDGTNTVTIPASASAEFIIPPGDFLESGQVLKLKTGQKVTVKALPKAGYNLGAQTTEWTFTGV